MDDIFASVNRYSWPLLWPLFALPGPLLSALAVATLALAADFFVGPGGVFVARGVDDLPGGAGSPGGVFALGGVLVEPGGFPGPLTEVGPAVERDVGDVGWVADRLVDGVAVAFGGLGGRSGFAWCAVCASGATVALGEAEGIGAGSGAVGAVAADHRPQ